MRLRRRLASLLNQSPENGVVQIVNVRFGLSVSQIQREKRTGECEGLLSAWRHEK